MSQEDELAKAVMNSRSDNMAYEEHTPEVHYNHYGSRGVVDLVEEYKTVEGDRPSIHIYEFKSPRAVREATGANEILRQFKRHKNYFFKGSSYVRRRYFSVVFELAFYATDEVVEHVRSNRSLYKTIQEHNRAGSESSRVHLRHPEVDVPGHVLENGETESGKTFWLHENHFSNVLSGVKETSEIYDTDE